MYYSPTNINKPKPLPAAKPIRGTSILPGAPAPPAPAPTTSNFSGVTPQGLASKKSQKPKQPVTAPSKNFSLAPAPAGQTTFERGMGPQWNAGMQPTLAQAMGSQPSMANGKLSPQQQAAWQQSLQASPINYGGVTPQGLASVNYPQPKPMANPPTTGNFGPTGLPITPQVQAQQQQWAQQQAMKPPVMPAKTWGPQVPQQNVYDSAQMQHGANAIYGTADQASIPWMAQNNAQPGMSLGPGQTGLAMNDFATNQANAELAAQGQLQQQGAANQQYDLARQQMGAQQGMTAYDLWRQLQNARVGNQQNNNNMLVQAMLGG